MPLNSAESQRRRRVLFVINSMGGGGAERVMATILANSGKSRESCEFGLAILDEGPVDFALPEWLPIYRLGCSGGLLSTIVKLDRLIGRIAPDVTVSFLTRANIATGIAMGRRRRPWIISERTSVPAHAGGRFRQLVTRLIMHRIYPAAARVIAVSDGVARGMLNYGVAGSRMAVIPNPVDRQALGAAACERAGVDIDGPFIVAVGRLVPVKNYRLLIEAFAKAALSCRLVLIGDGQESEKLAALAAELGLGERMVMPGWLRNPYPLMAKASAFALSSDVEGFPNALVEALALGVPVVATNCRDGPAEILLGKSANEVAGLAVAPSGVITPVGDVDAYARALQLVVAEREQFAAAAQPQSEAFAAPAIVARYWEVIDSVLAGGGRLSPS